MSKRITQPIEEWMDVKDPFFSEYFQISNLGRLKSKGRYVTRGGEKNRYEYFKPESIMKVRHSKEFPHLFATMIVKIDGEATVRTIYIHKAVAECFVPKPSEEHIYVEHIDGDYNNNTVSNLRWITASENSTKNIEKYPENRNKLRDVNIKNGYYKSLRSDAWNKKFTILQLFKRGIKIAKLAEMFGCSYGTIYNILKKQRSK